MITFDNACTIIAIREALNDPAWIRPEILINYNNERGLMGITMAQIAKVINFVHLPLFSILGHDSGVGINVPYFEVEVQGQPRIFVHRNTKTIVSYASNIPNIDHAECMSFSNFINHAAHMKRLQVIWDKRGCYTWGRPLK